MCGLVQSVVAATTPDLDSHVLGLVGPQGAAGGGVVALQLVPQGLLPVDGLGLGRCLEKCVVGTGEIKRPLFMLWPCC